MRPVFTSNQIASSAIADSQRQEPSSVSWQDIASFIIAYVKDAS